ncbi:MAG: type pilus modification protein PilV [Proteobacteria bacterium]|nr:type pilus modification protein PilV [Pseudomonadota bacterium]
MKSHCISMPGKRNQAGFLMIEVLITIVILALGLLGLAGLQAKIQTSETESFQRTQALLLLQDMVNRISANRLNAASYVTSSTCPLGTNSDACLGTPIPASCSGLAGAALDQCEWDHALKGAGEKAAGSGASIGAMVGARGCVELVAGSSPPLYRVSVAWQGMSQLKVPSLACGQNSYGGESYRRVIAGTVPVANLSN